MENNNINLFLGYQTSSKAKSHIIYIIYSLNESIFSKSISIFKKNMYNKYIINCRYV